MPQGKGTYGSKVGRPPKKLKKYQVGGEVTDVAEVIAEVAQMGQEFPTANAMERSESYQLGGPVRPPTAPSITPTPQYKEGGFIKKAVEKYKSKKAGKKREKARKKAVEDFPITGIVQPKKIGLKPAVVPSNPPLFEGDTTKEKIKNVGRKAVDLGSMGLTIGISKKKKGKKK